MLCYVWAIPFLLVDVLLTCSHHWVLGVGLILDPYMLCHSLGCQRVSCCQIQMKAAQKQCRHGNTYCASQYYHDRIFLQVLWNSLGDDWLSLPCCILLCFMCSQIAHLPCTECHLNTLQNKGLHQLSHHLPPLFHSCPDTFSKCCKRLQCQANHPANMDHESSTSHLFKCCCLSHSAIH